MKYMGLNEVREKFLSFFEEKGHMRLKSSSLVPKNDKSLLLINSGMAPLKPYFTGQEIPPSKRVTTCQKCIRTGDIENVGKTSRHATLFEMLGNFSFGDYFKEEIIPWSWEFVTEVMEIPVEKLYVSVYYEDDEAYDIWNKKVGLPKEKIVRLGKEDNFWEVGLGPCGPCSEIYYDKGEEFGCDSPTCAVGCDCERYLEFWNLVFTQFNKNEDGSYTKIDKPSIDTGMGLERMAEIMQGVNSISDVDTLKVIRDTVAEIANVKYGEESEEEDISIRIISDHVRAFTFLISDGVLPSNEGRGYVLRRLLRRAVRHGKLLGINDVFLAKVAKVIIDLSKDAYPELIEKQDYIIKVISTEEERFHERLDQGVELLKHIIEENKKIARNVILGNDAFKLYDTYGFPLELMKEILEEQKMAVDEEEFLKEMEKQRQRAREAREKTNYMGTNETIFSSLDPKIKTEFVGYNTLTKTDSKLLFLVKDNEIVEEVKTDDDICIILDETSFYAESGGQKGDYGKIYTNNGTCEIYDCVYVTSNKIAHVGKVIDGTIKSNDLCRTEVDRKSRLDTARNHTATHLLHKALKEVLGNHIEQAGSLVTKDRLRFDFTHFEAMTNEEIKKVEERVNEKILECIDIDISEKSIDEARKLGAMALFNEKYGDVVRVVSIGDYSIELCGGTHLKNTSEVGSFKLVSEGAVGAGSRRIEALTGKSALDYYKKLDKRLSLIASLLKVPEVGIIKRIEAFLQEFKVMTGQLEKISSKILGESLEEVIEKKILINDVDVVICKMDNLDLNSLRKMGDKIKEKLDSCVLVLASYKNEKVVLLAMATDDVVKRGVHSGLILKEISAIVDGSGGGRPNMAQAGGKDKSKIDDALKLAKEVIEKQLNKN